MFRVIIIALAMALSACSTAVVPKQAISSAIRADLKVVDVTVTGANGADVPEDVGPRLEKAVRLAIADRKPSGTTAVKLTVLVTRFEIVSGAARLFAGALPGSNKLNATVEIRDAQSGAIIGTFDVKRSANPGATGVLYSQTQGTIDAAATGVAEGIYGPKGK
jgi:hypothetical protein